MIERKHIPMHRSIAATSRPLLVRPNLGTTHPGASRPLRGQSLSRLIRAKSVRAMSGAGGISKDELLSTPGVTRQADLDSSTQDFIFQQTMYRIKDPKCGPPETQADPRSLDFYTRVIGMRLLSKLDFPDMTFSLYFLGFYPEQSIPEDPKERVQWMFSQPAVLELTHNHGTESNPEFQVHNGNKEPKGYGHIGLSVPDVEAACERFEKLGVSFVKKPNDGSMKGLAFIQDPDGYWIEILNAKHSAQAFG